MARKKRTSVDQFTHEAIARGKTYAQAQKEETVSLMDPIIVPPGYTKIADRLKEKAGE